MFIQRDKSSKAHRSLKAFIDVCWSEIPSPVSFRDRDIKPSLTLSIIHTFQTLWSHLFNSVVICIADNTVNIILNLLSLNAFSKWHRENEICVNVVRSIQSFYLIIVEGFRLFDEVWRVVNWAWEEEIVKDCCSLKNSNSRCSEHFFIWDWNLNLNDWLRVSLNHLSFIIYKI